MFATLVTVTLFAAAAFTGAVAQSDLNIDTPQATTCQPVTINWTGGNGPYDLIAVSPSDPCGDTPLVDFGVLNDNSVSWTPNLPAGTQLELSLEDANENVAWSGTITIAQGSDSSCISAAAASSAASSDASTSDASTSSVAVTGTTLVVTGTPAAASASSASTSSAASGPLGAVGNNGPLEASSNGAMTHATAPIMLLSTVAGFLAFSL